jgi:hypothetical protein
MSTKLSPLIRWLVWAALLEWLLARTLTRLGIFMPKSPAIISGYQLLTQVGQGAAAFAGVLVVAVLLGWAVRAWMDGNERPVAFILGMLVFLSTIFLFLQPPIFLSVFYQLLLLVGLLYLGWAGWQRARSFLGKPAHLVPALALLAGVWGHLAQLSGFLGLELVIFQTGELLVVLSAFLFWAAFGRPAQRLDWILAAAPALGFSVFRLLDPATTGILVIWSTGLTLYLPWPVYTLSIWLTGIALLTSLRRADPVAASILLFFSGGFAPQLSSQAFYGLVGLGLLGGRDVIVKLDESVNNNNKIPLPQVRLARGRE